MPKASVIIPTKNPGSIFPKVLNAVLEQHTPWTYEVLVVDSGSKDRTIEICKTYSQVRLVQIHPQEFGHGKTRNYAASLCDSEFVVFLTHDALPANSQWLANLINFIDQDQSIAGAFGRHLPYPQGNPFIARDLEMHFSHFRDFWPQVIRIDNLERYQQDIGYRQVLHFFSNNNSCLRKSVWLKFPFPDVDFAEDQIWAKLVLEAGYSKAYVDSAQVYHSHDYYPFEHFQRSFDESRALFKLFKYQQCPSLKFLIKNTIFCSINDFHYARKLQLNRNSLKWLFISPFLNIGKQLGAYLGQNSDILPEFISEFCSKDKSLLKKI